MTEDYSSFSLSPITHHPSPSLVEIWPEPSPGELMAILAALEQVVRGSSVSARPRRSAWAAAGRREATRAWESGRGSGWGQDREKLAAW